MKLLLPDATLRSPTAVAGKSDMTDQNVYSAIVCQHGGAGQQQLFTVPKGQSIPRLNGSGITVPTAAHQATYTELTTNISQAGQLGSALGDSAVRGIGCSIENAYVTAATGALNTYGAGQQEVNEILAKSFFQFRIGGKLQIQGPVIAFPSFGSAAGGVFTTANAMTVSNLNNGLPGSTRRLKLPILVARTDTVEGTWGVAGGSSYTFSVTSGIGQPVLVWVNLSTIVKGDAR